MNAGLALLVEYGLQVKECPYLRIGPSIPASWYMDHVDGLMKQSVQTVGDPLGRNERSHTGIETTMSC